MTKQIIGGYLPLFGGFYESVESAYFDERDQNNQENGGKELDFDDFQKKAAKVWVDEVNKITPDWLKFEFEEVKSPKYYNFETDTIHTKTTVDLRELMVFVCESKNYERFNQYCIDNFTSRSGFSSFFPNSADEYLRVLATDKNDTKYYNHIIDFVVNLLNSEIDESERVESCVYEKLYEIDINEIENDSI